MKNKRKKEKREFILRKFGEKIKNETSFVAVSRLTGIPLSTVKNFYQKGTGGKSNILKICNAMDWVKDEIFTTKEWALINNGRGTEETLEEQLDEVEDLFLGLEEENELEDEFQSLILKMQIVKAFADYLNYEADKLKEKVQRSKEYAEE